MSELCRELVSKGCYDEILKEHSSAEIEKYLDFKLLHVGINSSDRNEAEKTACGFTELFGFIISTTPRSFFAGNSIEVMDNSVHGKNGHIAIHTADIAFAEFYFKKRGYNFIEESRTKYPDGNTRLIYFSHEIGGFAIHLTGDDTASN